LRLYRFICYFDNLLRSSQFYLFYLKYFRNHKLTPDANKTLIIEGYPRSANSFIEALIYFNNRDLLYENKISSHTHSISSLKFGIKKKIPIIVVLRDPIDSISSLKIRRSNLPIEMLIFRYIYFYKFVHKNLKKFMILEFNEYTKEYSQTLKKINKFFNLKLDVNNIKRESIYDLIDNISLLRGTIKKYEPYNIYKTTLSEKLTQKEKKLKIIKQIKSEKYKILINESYSIYEKILSSRK